MTFRRMVWRIGFPQAGPGTPPLRYFVSLSPEGGIVRGVNDMCGRHPGGGRDPGCEMVAVIALAFDLTPGAPSPPGEGELTR